MSYASEVYLLAVPMHKITGLTWLNFSGLLSYAGVSLHLAMHFLAFFLAQWGLNFSKSNSNFSYFEEKGDGLTFWEVAVFSEADQCYSNWLPYALHYYPLSIRKKPLEKMFFDFKKVGESINACSNLFLPPVNLYY